MHQIRCIDSHSTGTILNNIQDKTNRTHIGNEVWAAVAHKRQRNTGDGQYADAHANVFKYVSEEHSHNTNDNQASIFILRVVR